MLKAEKIGDKKRLDAMGTSYRVVGLPEVYIHGHTYQRKGFGTCTSYTARVDSKEVASATTLRALLVRVERAGMRGFFSLFARKGA